MSSRDEFTERTKKADAARALALPLPDVRSQRAERGILRGGDQNVLRRAIAAWERLFAEVGIPV